jgi:hypothetical protein
MGSIFSWIEDQVTGVMTEWLSKLTGIPDLIEAPIKAIVEQVTGGIWKGDGATRFAEEMTGEVIPMVANIFTMGSSWMSALKAGNDMIADAMRQATSAVDEAIDFFDSIF